MSDQAAALQLQLVMEHAPLAIALLDRDMRYVQVSRRFVSDLGLGEVDLKGRSHDEVFPETPDPWRKVCARCLLGAKEGTLEDSFVRPDGSAEWVRWEAIPWTTPTGEVDGLLLMIEVISERKRLEGALRVAGEEARLARADAETARSEAVAANRMKDEFLALLGHELRNPLAPILTALQLMKIRGPEESTRERTIIERQVQHLVSLVDDLLDVSRITRGAIELKKRPLETSQIIGLAIEMASPLFEQRSHNLRINVLRSGLVVDADEVRMAQVISNLLTNAAKYTDAGGDISVSAAHEGDEVVIRVRDNGLGIAHEMLPKVFDMFVQGERTVHRARGGLGIGLTIVRSLVELHGGQVQATSPGLGSGAEFEVRLPAARHAPVDAEPLDVEAPLALDAPALRGRILVVDDNIDAAETLADILSAFGYVTRMAHDGPTALVEAARFHPDVALLDIGLPVMDGYELGRRLREQAGDTPLRLIAVTGYGQESDRERSRAAGFHEHMVKPIKLEELRVVLEKV